MAEKGTVLLFTRYRKQIEKLDMEERGEVLTAIYAYADEGEEIAFQSLRAELLFSVIKDDIDSNNEKYREQCEQNKLNGQKGGRPRKDTEKEENRAVIADENEKPKKPSGFSENPNNPSGFSKTLYDNDYEYDNEYEKDNNTPLTPQGGTGKGKKPATDLQIEAVNADARFSVEMKGAVCEWLRHHKERAKPYQEIGFNKLLNLIRQKVDDYGEKAVRDVIDLSIANSYQGIVWDKLDKGRSAPMRAAPKSAIDSFPSGKRNLDYLVE